MKGIEFGNAGAEGIRHEGIYENNGWSSLEKEPFAGDATMDEAEHISEELDKIRIRDDDDQIPSGEDDANKFDGVTSEVSDSEESNENAFSQSSRESIAALKKDLSGLFDVTSVQSPNSNINSGSHSESVTPKASTVKESTDKTK